MNLCGGFQISETKMKLLRTDRPGQRGRHIPLAKITDGAESACPWDAPMTVQGSVGASTDGEFGDHAGSPYEKQRLHDNPVRRGQRRGCGEDEETMAPCEKVSSREQRLFRERMWRFAFREATGPRIVGARIAVHEQDVITGQPRLRCR